jgi:hypothetical protein
LDRVNPLYPPGGIGIGTHECCCCRNLTSVRSNNFASRGASLLSFTDSYRLEFHHNIVR